jgi:Protein of unknown function (DUF2934)
MRDTTDQIVTHEEIEKRAYDIYLRRGGGDGRDLDDWFAAEQELAQERSQESEVYWSGGQEQPLGRRLRSEAAGTR